MDTFRDYLLAEAKKEEAKYSDMQVKTDKELAADTAKIKMDKKKAK